MYLIFSRWARSSARLERRAFMLCRRNPDAAGSKDFPGSPAGPILLLRSLRY